MLRNFFLIFNEVPFNYCAITSRIFNFFFMKYHLMISVLLAEEYIKLNYLNVRLLKNNINYIL